MDAAVLERFRLPGPHRDHHAIARSKDDPRAELVDSVMPKVVSMCNQFRSRLREREQHAFDLEDLLQEIWMELLQKAHYYQEDRSKYITFALRLVSNKLAEVRNRWHTVAGPRDAAARLRAGDGTINSTTERVRQTARDTVSLTAEPAEIIDDEDGFETTLAAAERAQRTAVPINTALDLLARRSAMKCRIVELTYGIGDRPELEPGQIAALLNLTVAQVLATKTEAERELAALIIQSDPEGTLQLGVA